MNQKRRSRFLRALGWGIGAFASGAAILLLLVAAYLLFADYPEQLRRALEDQLTRVSGAPATIRSIRLDLPRYRFELVGVTVATPRSEDPILELGRVSGKLRVRELLGLRVLWEDLHFDSLTLHLVEESEEGLALAGGTLAARPFGGLALAADRISVENGVLVIANERVPWQLDASDLSVAITRIGAASYEGKLEYDSGRLKIKDHEDVQASLTADFELHPSELLLRQASVSSEVGLVDFTGKLGFADGVRGRFAVNGEGDAARAAESLFGLKDWSRWAEGRASFRGTLSVEPGNKVLQGTILLPEGELSGIALSSWTGEVFWDRSLLQVSYARGILAGGAMKVQVHQPLPAAEHRAALEWEVEASSLARILEGATGRPSPIDSLVSGRGSLSFAVEASEGGESTFELRGAAPELSDAIGVSFVAEGRLVPAGIEIANTEFRTPFLSGSLSGFYPREGSARISFDLETTDLAATDVLQRDLNRMAQASDGAEPRLFHLSGRAQVRGDLTARLPDASFEGDFSGEDLRYESFPLGNVRALLSWSPDRIRLDDLVAAKAGGGLAGRAALSPTHPHPARGLELDVTLSRWPVEELAKAIDAPVPIEGSVSGRIRTRPGAGGLEGDAVLELLDGAIAGIPFERGKTHLTLDGTRIRLDPVTLARGNATVSGRMEIDADGPALGGILETRRYPLDGLGPKWAELSGTLEGKVEVSGSFAEPAAALSARGRNVRIRGVDLGEAFVSGGLRGDEFLLSVTLESEARDLALEAEVGLAPPFLARGRARWHQIDTSGWVGLPAGTRAVSDGVATFRVPLRGEDVPAAAEADIELGELSVEGESLRLESGSPIQIRLRGGRLELARATLTEGATSLTLGGGLDLADGSLDVEVDGTVSFGVLETFYPSLGLATTGETFVSARVTGTRESPSITGYADFRGGSIRFSGFRQAVAELDGRIVFDNRTLRIPGLRGVFGSGPVEIAGTIGIEGVSPATVDLSLKGSGVRLRYPEGFAATLDAELSLLGSPNERILSGTLVLADATWTREYDLVSGILSDREGLSLFDDLSASELLGNLRLDVAIQAPESLRVRNSLANIEGSAELELRGTVSEPVLLGRSEAERGDLYFLGQRYTITTGKVDFVDPTRIEPFVDLVAETRVRSYRVELRLTGTPQRVHPELSSDPPLRTVDILRLLAGANERDIFIGNEEEELAGVGVASLLTERLTQEVGKRAERLFGLDRFSINPFLVGQFANPTARVSLGKQFTRELSINYSTNLNATTEAIILIEYTPEGPMSWILSRDEEGDVGIDVKFRKSF